MRINSLVIVLALCCLILGTTTYAQPSISTPHKKPLAGAKVRVTYVTGESFEAVLDANGQLTLRNVPLGKANVTIIEWKGVPIGVTYTVTYYNPVILCREIGCLEVKVVGARGQEIQGATVTIIYGEKVVETGATDASGLYVTELPQATYKVKATYGGKEASAEVTIKGMETSRITLQLDIFISIAGWSLTLPEFIGLIVLIVLVIVALFLVMHEYSVWRRKKLAKALTVPARR